MRRLVAALIMATLAATLVACATDTTTTTTGVPVTGTVVTGTGTTSTSASEGTDTLSPVRNSTGDPLPNRIDETPDVVLADLKNRMPMMIYFYDATQAITTRQNRENDAAVAKYRGTLDYLSFNINTGIPGSGSSEDTQTRKAILLAANLEVPFTPCVIFVDSYGRITFAREGFLDRKLLEREILRATGQ